MENGELKRILEMVETRKISAAEGARLMDSFRASAAGNAKTCPYCAESIPSQSRRCPECGSDLDSPHLVAAEGFGFGALTGLGKFLVVYTLLVSGISLLSLFSAFGPPALTGCLLATLGLASGIMILKGNPSGWGLGMLWAGLQIITVVVQGAVINQQVFHIGYNSYVNGQGFGINLVGIVLLILFIKAKPANN